MILFCLFVDFKKELHAVYRLDHMDKRCDIFTLLLCRCPIKCHRISPRRFLFFHQFLDVVLSEIPLTKLIQRMDLFH